MLSLPVRQPKLIAFALALIEVIQLIISAQLLLSSLSLKHVLEIIIGTGVTEEVHILAFVTGC